MFLYFLHFVYKLYLYICNEKEKIVKDIIIFNYYT